MERTHRILNGVAVLSKHGSVSELRLIFEQIPRAEVAPFMILPLFMMATLLAVIVHTKRVKA